MEDSKFDRADADLEERFDEVSEEELVEVRGGAGALSTHLVGGVRDMVLSS